MNFEVRNSIGFNFLKSKEQSDSALQHSAVRYSAVLRFAFLLVDFRNNKGAKALLHETT